MLDWLRGWLSRSRTPVRPVAAERPSFQPPGARVALSRNDVEALLEEQRAVVFVSVEWSGPERFSRIAFVDLMHRLAGPGPNISRWVLNEYTEGIAELFTRLKLLPTASGGYGAVIWLQCGTVLDVIPNASECGVNELVRRTSELWKEDQSPVT